MQLPIDVKALIDEATNIDTARNTPLSVSVYIDEAAPADLIAHVRSMFASELPTVRLTITYLDDAANPRPLDDMAVIVAGASEIVGARAAGIRAVGVPVMVATNLPQIVSGLATAEGAPIPEGDLIAPEVEEPSLAAEPYALDDDLRASLDDRMGRWIVAACRDKRLAFAVAFAFVRRPLARDAVFSTAVQNAGIGLVPFIPGADLPIMTLNQAKMALQIAAAYGQPMGTDRIKEIIAIVGGAFACRTLARELAEFVPVLGFIIRPGIGYTATAAIGFAIIEYFEGGQNLTGVANVASVALEKGGKVAKLLSGKLGPLLGAHK